MGWRLCRLGDDLLVEDAHWADHQQPHVGHEVVGQLPVGDVGAGDVQAEVLALDAAAVREVDLEVESDSLVHVGVP